MPNGRSLVVVVFLTAFINFLGITIIFPVVGPLLLKSGLFFGPDEEEAAIRWVGVLKAVYPLMMVVGAPLMGSLADLWGRKRVLMAAVAGSMVGYGIFLVGIWTARLELLMAGRLIDGLTGANTAMLYATIADVVPPARRGRYFGLITAAFGAGFILGPFLGGVLSDPAVHPAFYYTTPFFLTLALLAVNLGFVGRFYPETFQTGQSTPWADRFRWGWLWRHPQRIGWLLLGGFLAWLGFSAYTQFVDVVLIRKFDMSVRQLGIFFGYVGFWIIFTQTVLNHYLSKRWTSHRMLMITLPALVVSFLVFAWAPSVAWAYATIPLISIHHGLSYPHYLSMLSAQVDSSFQGRLLGAYQAVQSLAIGLAPLAVAPVAARWVNGPLVAAAVISAGAFGVYRWWSARYAKRSGAGR